MQNRLGHKEASEESGVASRGRRILSLAVIAVGGLVFALSIFYRASALQPKVEMQAVTADALSSVTQDEGRDFSKFTHTNAVHSRLPCLLCHRREGNSPRPVRSAGHAPCAGCHQQQFQDSGSPICTICHTDPTSSTPQVKPFPSMRSFNMKFDHARHTRGGAPALQCASCHRPERRGVSLSIPSGFDAHATCFRCHTPRAVAQDGRDISSCGTCHRIGGYSRTPENARAYSTTPFSHAKHTQRLNCADCHTVRAVAAQGRQVSAPVPLMHHAPAGALSCIACHNDKRAFGGDDFTDCKRCHQGNAWHF